MLFQCFFYIITVEKVLGTDAEVVVLRAARGRDARLPCGQGKVFLDGPDAYVLWLKNEHDFLQRYPKEESETRLVYNNRIFTTSCESGSCVDETTLLIKKVMDQDGGIYRCRVHYQASPSVDYVIDVKVVDSSSMPRLYNDAGDEINKGYVGPLSLGSDITLICEVEDNRFETEVHWYRNGVMLERAHTVRPGVLRAEVHVLNVTRSEVNAHYECSAQNADVSEPLVSSVTVKMYLPPLSVEIRLNKNIDFEAGQPRVVDCVIVGCVPPPSITWQLGDTMLRPNVHKELHDGNYTVSSLTLAPSLRDNKRELVCTAHNSQMPLSVFEDKVTLNVGYRPICVSNREETIGSVVREAETVTCVVEASPEPLQFIWIFADSKTLYTMPTDVPGHRNRYSSTLTWLAREEDIGLLLCRATNAFGEQKRPCTFTISPGGPPLTPDCVVLRSYPNSLRVQCKKGWDGGRPQTIHLEIVDKDGTTLHNVSDPAGNFHISDIEKDLNLTILIYASSSRGKSEVKTMHLQTMTPLSATALTEAIPWTGWLRWAEVATGCVALFVGTFTITICIKILKARGDATEMNPDLVPTSDGSFHREPDFAREERLLGTTNITVNQLGSCANQYSSSPGPCRVLVGVGSPQSSSDSCLSSLHSYYV